MSGVRTALGNLTQKGGRRLAARSRWALRVSAEGVRDAMHATRRAGEGLRDGAINVGKALLRSVRRPVRRARRRRNQRDEQRQFDQIQWQVEREIEEAVGRGRLLVAGPWL